MYVFSSCNGSYIPSPHDVQLCEEDNCQQGWYRSCHYLSCNWRYPTETEASNGISIITAARPIMETSVITSVQDARGEAARSGRGKINLQWGLIAGNQPGALPASAPWYVSYCCTGVRMWSLRLMSVSVSTVGTGWTDTRSIPDSRHTSGHVVQWSSSAECQKPFPCSATDGTWFCLRFEVFTAATMKNGVFWDVMSCGSCKNRCYVGT
jgi:hypothetical protein